MARINNTTSVLLLPALLLAVSACGQAAEENKNPPIIRTMQAEGLEVLGEFDAPSGLRGYAGLAGGQPLTVYATADGQHAVVGMLINAKGEDIGAEPLQRLVAEPMSRRIWSQLEASHWIADGKTMRLASFTPSAIPIARTATGSGKRRGRGLTRARCNCGTSWWA